MDNIRVSFSGNAEIEKIAERNAQEIADETLAKDVLFNTPLEFSKEWNVNGETVTISVEKV